MVPAPLSTPQPPYYGYGRIPPPVAHGGPPSGSAASGPQKVALLVPLSGANAELGQALLDAAQLALFETGGDRLTLVPRDTGGSGAGATSAARAVVGEGVHLILGPLLAPEVEAVKPIAQGAHINVIAFSTVTKLAGGNLYLMGFLPRQEVTREVAYARQRGLARFAALAPNSPYGHLMADALREVASANGGTVAKVEFYDQRAGDVTAQVRQLLPGGAAEADAALLPTPPRVPSFEALLLPEDGARLKQIARQVRDAAGSNKPVQLLGSGLWDTPDIGGEPALAGGWYASSPPEARQDFELRFNATYGHKPPRLASLGYDAATLAAVLAREPSGEPFSREGILNPSGFTGIDGLFRFSPDGLVQRGLAVLEVEPQGPIVVSPPPRSFQDLGY
jgi:ABC-type branched-subunit amino acid transport system substrate-binding protein